jgi:DNA primase
MKICLWKSCSYSTSRKDPDEYIREFGIDAYKEHIKSAPLLIDFQLNQILKEKTNDLSPTDKVKLVRKIIPLLEEIKNNIVQNEYIKLVANRLNVDEAALSKEIGKIESLEATNVQETSLIVTKTLNISEKAQKNLLSLYLIPESHLDFDTLSNIIKNVKFDNKKLNILKNTIDKLICRMNNVGELIDALYTHFIEDNDLKEIITDLIYL